MRSLKPVIVTRHVSFTKPIISVSRKTGFSPFFFFSSYFYPPLRRRLLLPLLLRYYYNAIVAVVVVVVTGITFDFDNMVKNRSIGDDRARGRSVWAGTVDRSSEWISADDVVVGGGRTDRGVRWPWTA